MMKLHQVNQLIWWSLALVLAVNEVLVEAQKFIDENEFDTNEPEVRDTDEQDKRKPFTSRGLVDILSGGMIPSLQKGNGIIPFRNWDQILRIDKNPSLNGLTSMFPKEAVARGTSAVEAAVAAPAVVAESMSKGTKSLAALNSATDMAQLLTNPSEFFRTICKQFDVPCDRFTETISKQFVAGMNTLLQPLASTLKMSETMLAPDQCRLRSLCDFGTRMEFIRDLFVKLTPSHLEESSQLKAFSDGVIGRSCDKIFPACEPMFKQFESMRDNLKDNLKST